MIPKPIKEITTEDIKICIENQIPEGKTIDYKQKISIASNDDKKEFYKDISAFANAEGGDIVYGVSEENRFPKEIIGIEIENLDATLLQLSNMIRSGIEPTIIPQPEFSNPLKIDDDKYVIVLRVYKSFTAPNRISFEGNHKFWIRGDGGNGEMSVTELRNAFTLSQSVVERIQNFRLERLQKLIAGDTPVPFTTRFKGKMMLHLVPLQSFTENRLFDINSIKIENILKSNLFSSIESDGDFPTYNLEGFLKHRSIDSTGGTYTYVQFFRKGIIEAGFGACLYNDGSFIPKCLELLIIKYSYNYLELMKKLDIMPPIYFMLTFCDIKGSTFNPATIWTANSMGSEDFKFKKDLLSLPEVLINEYASSEEELIKILKPTFDIIMNAFGRKAM